MPSPLLIFANMSLIDFHSLSRAIALNATTVPGVPTSDSLLSGEVGSYRRSTRTIHENLYPV